MANRIRIVIGDSQFEAELLEQAAPKTCKAVLDSLPVSGEVIHSSWSGDNLSVHLDPAKVRGQFEQENLSIYGSPGDVAWFVRRHEVFITYGKAQYRFRTGDVQANVFATITKDRELLTKVGTKILREGVSTTEISVMD
jgi:hypothetical protein